MNLVSMLTSNFFNFINSTSNMNILSKFNQNSFFVHMLKQHSDYVVHWDRLEESLCDDS